MILKRDVQVGIEMAWHKLTKVEEVITKDNCRIAYPMEMQPTQFPDGVETGEYGIRSLDDGLQVGRAVTAGYKLISNDRMLDTIETSLAGTTHKIVSVGTLQNRSKCFASIKLSENITAGNRETQNVLNVLWGHGGVFSVKARSGFTVVVCRNTFNLSLKNNAEFELSLLHKGNVELKLENMHKAIDAHYGVVAEFKKVMDEFEATPCSEDTARKVIAGFVVRDAEEEISANAVNRIGRLETLFKVGDGNRGKTRCDLFNAFTDFLTHESSGGIESAWRQYESSEFGTGAKRKSEAYALLTGEKVRDCGDWAEVEARGEKVLQLI